MPVGVKRRRDGRVRRFDHRRLELLGPFGDDLGWVALEELRVGVHAGDRQLVAVLVECLLGTVEQVRHIGGRDGDCAVRQRHHRQLVSVKQLDFGTQRARQLLRLLHGARRAFREVYGAQNLLLRIGHVRPSH